MPGFGVIGAEGRAAKQAVKAAGLHEVLVQAFWDRLQPSGPGTALSGSAVAALNQEITDAVELGLGVSFEYAPHYPPAWVKTGAAAVEAFVDQGGAAYTSNDPGKDVRNWVWTARGRGYIEDFYRKVWAALTPASRAAVAFVKFGGGYYGEVQYPVEVGGAPYRYRGFGTSMQTGTGLAPGLPACPVPEYTPFTGTDAQDVAWTNWWLWGLENFVSWQITLLKDIGWTCTLYALHSGYSVRRNQTRAQNGWRENMARGHDFTRLLGVYKRDPQVWPWCTWLGGPDGWHTPTVDSDQAAWKKLLVEAQLRGKAALLGGENTGGESSDAMDAIAAGAFTGPSNAVIFERPGYAFQPYARMQWLNYADLTGGASGRATLARYAARSAALTG